MLKGILIVRSLVYAKTCRVERAAHDSQRADSKLCKSMMAKSARIRIVLLTPVIDRKVIDGYPVCTQ